MTPRESGRKGGMAARGSQKGTAKLTESDVQLILSSCDPSPALAKQLGVSDGHVRHIRSRKWWRHVQCSL